MNCAFLYQKMIAVYSGSAPTVDSVATTTERTPLLSDESSHSTRMKQDFSKM